MTYQTLYRKYRSSDFNELVGQDHIIKTLSNAIEYERLSHAYIFSGPRGTGKTSTARILAKMVNKTQDEMAGCDICNKITAGVCIDVIEIDAASHTGVDHMRQLTEQVQFLPIEAKYKVFIIDEVHMLSTGAFNALLKTLEEPPANILFILATTELHKIPATIQSRAQTLHFRLLENDQITQHLRHVSSQENIQVSDAVLAKIVQSSNGGMRDALSLLDQLISVSTGSEITMDDISLVLGTLTDDVIVEFLALCFSGSSDAVHQLCDFINQGINVFQFYDDVLSYLNHRFLVSRNNDFDVSDTVVSDWMLWFCEELARLKSVPLVDIAAQVSLNSKLLSAKDIVIARPEDRVASSKSLDPTPKVANVTPKVENVTPKVADVTSANPSIESHANTNEPQIVKSADEPILKVEPPKHAKVDRSSQLSDKAEVVSMIIAKVNQEFKVLAPVLEGASFLEKGDRLCLVLEQSYQFFEKKLSEPKFQSWFLAQYNQLANTALTEWFVTSDINDVYKFSVEKNDGISENNNKGGYVKSNTINQIVEMFDAHVIH